MMNSPHSVQSEKLARSIMSTVCVPALNGLHLNRLPHMAMHSCICKRKMWCLFLAMQLVLCVINFDRYPKCNSGKPRAAQHGVICLHNMCVWRSASRARYKREKQRLERERKKRKSQRKHGRDLPKAPLRFVKLLTSVNIDWQVIMFTPVWPPFRPVLILINNQNSSKEFKNIFMPCRYVFRKVGFGNWTKF